jgi:hypothetical protein
MCWCICHQASCLQTLYLDPNSGTVPSKLGRIPHGNIQDCQSTIRSWEVCWLIQSLGKFDFRPSSPICVDHKPCIGISRGSVKEPGSCFWEWFFNCNLGNWCSKRDRRRRGEQTSLSCFSRILGMHCVRSGKIRCARLCGLRLSRR